MDSKKRLTQTKIWDDPVFIELTPSQKLLWFFINDRCDNIGVWTPNPKLIAFSLDIEDDPRQFLNDFLQAINSGEEVISVINSGDWFIYNFVKFQYCQKKPLHENSPSHKSYLLLIKDRGLSEWFYLNYPECLPESFLEQHLKTPKRPLLEPSETYKDKDTDKEKAQEEVKEMDADKDTPFSEGNPSDFEARTKWSEEGTPFNYKTGL